MITLDYDIKYYGFKKTFRYQLLRFLRYRFRWKILYRKSSNKRVHILINKDFGFFFNLLIRFLLMDDIERIKHDIRKFFEYHKDYKLYTNRLYDKKITFIVDSRKMKIKEREAGKWKILS